MAVLHPTELSKTSALTWTKLPSGEACVLGPRTRPLGTSWSAMVLPMGLTTSLRSWSAIGEKLCLFFSCVFDLLVAFLDSACCFSAVSLILLVPFQLCL